ncbi:hypothetical protein [Rubrimonas cliftonensis]|uniref:Uncharacterized protein n=1 Tax=Rubrimonas cliftonensis TaxID=89524 RepID=A0A1H4EJC4_9RHOB|nr:hypothetical protein [Rubrimonas cliftonensis]SEA84352.1 hypothetical protein SAMN05444370_1143 [Rubrimonas cliftonensis]
MTQVRLFGGTLAALIIAASAGASWAEQLASLTASLSLRDPVSGVVVKAEGGAPVRLRVALTDPATGRPPRGIDLLGWVRPVERGDAGCARAAQNFRATRRIPLGAVDLNSLLVVALNRDATLSVVDPALDLYSSNMVAAHRLETMPAAMAIDDRHMRAVFAWPGSGRIEAARLTGPESETLVDELPGVAALTVSRRGDIWAGDSAGRLHRIAPDGARMSALQLGRGPVEIRHRLDDADDTLGAFTAEGEAVMLDATTGETLMRARFSAPIADVSFFGGVGAIAVMAHSAAAELRFHDAPEMAFAIPLGAPFARISTGPDARIGVVWSPGDAIVALIDMALGRVVQSIELIDATVSEVAFTDHRAFILSHDGGFIGAIDLAAVAVGSAATVQRSDMGARSARPVVEQGPSRLLAPLPPRPQVLAVDAERQTAWLAEEVGATVEMPPMRSIRLRGGQPQAVAVAERRFEEVEPGVFETVWAFAPGAQELVLTTYTGQLSTCLPFEVSGHAQREALTPVRLSRASSAAPIAGAEHEIALHVIGPDDAALPVRRLTLAFPSMVSSWAGRVVAEADSTGVLRATVTLPHAGPYTVHPLDLPSPLALSAALVIKAVETAADETGETR